MPACGNAVDVRLRLLDRDVRFQSRDALEKVVVPLLRQWRSAILGFAQTRHRDPKFRRNRSNRKSKPWGHHPDYLEFLTVERNGFADNVAIRSKPALPQRMAQNDHMISWIVFVRQNRAAEHRLNSEQRKQIGRYRFALNMQSSVSICERAHALVCVDRDSLKNL